MLRGKFEGLLDTEDVAKILGCHRETVRVLIRRGVLKPIDSKRPFAFDRESVNALPPVRIGRPRKTA
jgi:excisionase family DNA binding protein